MLGRLEFTDSENPWSPVDTIAEINERTGADLQLIGLDDQTGGTSSAAYARRRGTDVEVAITRTTAAFTEMSLTAEVLELARAMGCPVPHHEDTVKLSDGYVAIVQQRLPGRRPGRVDAATIDAMVAANDGFAGLLIDRPDVPAPSAFAATQANGWDSTLGTYSARSRRLLDRHRPHHRGMTGDDLIHLDYSLGNVLYDAPRTVSAIVDWNRGVARGDRWYALIGTEFNLASEGELYGVTADAVDHLAAILSTLLDPETLACYREHWHLDNAHRSIANRFPAGRVDQDLDQAERHLT